MHSGIPAEVRRRCRDTGADRRLPAGPGIGRSALSRHCRGRSRFPVTHGVHDAARQFLAIVDLRQLRENAFERGLTHEFAKFIDRVVGRHFAAAQDQDRGAYLLDHLKDVRAIQDDFAAVRQGAQQRRNIRAEVTSRPENGSSRIRISGSCSKAAERRTFCRMPFE